MLNSSNREMKVTKLKVTKLHDATTCMFIRSWWTSIGNYNHLVDKAHRRTVYSLWLDQGNTSRKCAKWTTCLELPVETYYVAVTLRKAFERREPALQEEFTYCMEETSRTNTRRSREDARKQTVHAVLASTSTWKSKIWNVVEKETCRIYGMTVVR